MSTYPDTEIEKRIERVAEFGRQHPQRRLGVKLGNGPGKVMIQANAALKDGPYTVWWFWADKLTHFRANEAWFLHFVLLTDGPPGYVSTWYKCKEV